MIFKQSHDNRCRNIIGKIRHNLDGSSPIFVLYDLIQIHLEDILVDDRYIIVCRKGVLQNRDQILVNFHRTHTPRSIRKILRQRTDTGANLQHRILVRQLCSRDNIAHDIFINQKVLSQLLICTQLKAVQDVISHLGRSNYRFIHVSLSNFC